MPSIEDLCTTSIETQHKLGNIPHDAMKLEQSDETMKRLSRARYLGNKQWRHPWWGRHAA